MGGFKNSIEFPSEAARSRVLSVFDYNDILIVKWKRLGY